MHDWYQSSTSTVRACRGSVGSVGGVNEASCARSRSGNGVAITGYPRRMAPGSVLRTRASVSVGRGVRVIEQAALQKTVDLVDSLSERMLSFELHAPGELLEADAIVARILVFVHELDLPVREPRIEELDDVELSIVLICIADVVDLAGDGLSRPLEHLHDRAGGVADVDIRSPELLAEYDQLSLHGEIARELVHRQIKAHPRRCAVDGREAKARRRQPVGSTQHVLLGCDLRLGVERDRPELDRLVGDRIPVDPSVVAAGRGEDEALDTRLLGIVEQLPGAVDVDLHCELRLAGARRIADDCREMDNGFVPLECSGAIGRIPDIPANELEATVAPWQEQGWHAPVHESIECPDAKSAGEGILDHDRADVPRAAGDEKDAIHHSYSDRFHENRKPWRPFSRACRAWSPAGRPRVPVRSASLSGKEPRPT